jgi:hypothetical protein
MKHSPTAVLPLAEHKAWLLRETGHSKLTAQLVGPTDSAEPPVELGSSLGGWDAVLDHEGAAWVAHIDGLNNCVYVRKAVGHAWGPPLQVSSASGSDPLIRADEYSNVWVFWTVEPDGNAPWEIRVCRMGPRSGQETAVAQFPDQPSILDAGTRGGAIWLLVRCAGESPLLISGTEHGGFRSPARVE